MNTQAHTTNPNLQPYTLTPNPIRGDGKQKLFQAPGTGLEGCQSNTRRAGLARDVADDSKESLSLLEAIHLKPVTQNRTETAAGPQHDARKAQTSDTNKKNANAANGALES